MNRNGDIGVIFDMDGVLVDSAKPHLRSWQLLAEENGRNVTEARFAATFGQQNRDIIPLLFGETDAATMLTLSDRKESLYRDLVRSDPPVMDGAADLVHALASAGVRLAVGSSGPIENIELMLAAMGIRDRFTTIVSAEDVQRGKPDPEVFTLACRRIGVPPHRCVVIEDAPVGVAAARASGARCIGLTTNYPADVLSEADLIVGSLSELTAQTIAALALQDTDPHAP